MTKILQTGKDFIVVESFEIAEGLIKHNGPKSLAGKYIIVAPQGLEFVDVEDLMKLPKLREALKKEILACIGEERGFDDYEWGSFAEGWNACLDEMNANLDKLFGEKDA